jgi:hypothetical protein
LDQRRLVDQGRRRHHAFGQEALTGIVQTSFRSEKEKPQGAQGAQGTREFISGPFCAPRALAAFLLIEIWPADLAQRHDTRALFRRSSSKPSNSHPALPPLGAPAVVHPQPPLACAWSPLPDPPVPALPDDAPPPAPEPLDVDAVPELPDPLMVPLLPLLPLSISQVPAMHAPPGHTVPSGLKLFAH